MTFMPSSMKALVAARPMPDAPPVASEADADAILAEIRELSGTIRARLLNRVA